MKHRIQNLIKVKTTLLLIFGSFLISCNSDSLEKGSIKQESLENEKGKFFQGLGSIMLDIQARHTKLYYAGSNENWELAAFVLSEMKESFKDITRYHRSHDEVNLNKLTNKIMIPSIDDLNSVIAKGDLDSFNSGFEQLTVSCNKCHSVAKHSFIKIRKPLTGDFLNQEFSK